MIALIKITGWEWVGGVAIFLVGVALVKHKEADADRENKEGAETLERWMAKEREIAKKQAEQS